MKDMTRKLFLGLNLALILALILATGAFADTLVADGDITTTSADPLNFGTVCVNSTTTKSVALSISRQGNYSTAQVFKDGTSTSISVDSTSTGLSALINGSGIITIPSNWDSALNGASTGSVSSSVSFFAGGTPGIFNGTINYKATGTQARDNSVLTRTGNLSVTATISNTGTCAPPPPSDSTPPILHLPSNITMEASGPSGAIVTFTASATDTNPVSPTVLCTPASGGTFALGINTVSCSATDAAGNTANGSFTVTVQDTTAPIIAAHDDVTREATSAAGAVVIYTAPSTSDAVDGAGTALCAPASDSTFALGDTTVTCNAIDSAGNHATVTTFKVSVQDTTPPSVTVPGNITAEATGPTGAVVPFAASATDLVDGSVSVSCLPVSGSTFSLGSQTVTCSATDAHGNEGSASFTVTVQDTTAPVIAAHDDVTAEATSALGAVVTYTAPATSDAVDGDGTATCAPTSGSTFALGDNTITCNATDAAGNDAISTTFKVTVRDTTPPVISGMPADITSEATSAAGARVYYTAPTALDLVDGAVTPVCTHSSGSTFPLAATTVLCTATDAHGNTSSASFKVTVVDTTPPAVTVPADITAEATGPTGAPVSFTASATDLVDGSVSVSCLPVSGSTFSLGSQTVTCSATDAHGNEGSASFTVTVQDTTPPTISNHADIGPIVATSAAGAVVTYTSPATSDAVDGAGTATCVPLSGSTFALGDTTVTCSATDAHGNVATPITFKVMIRFAVGGVNCYGGPSHTILQPINADGSSVWKARNTIPVKFRVCDANGNSIGGSIAAVFDTTLGKSAVPYIYQTTSLTNNVDESAVSNTPDLQFRWDASAQQWIFNLNTTNLSGGKTYSYHVYLIDGTTIDFTFGLK